MLSSWNFKGRLTMPVLRAHASTVAVAMGLGSWWRVPRDAAQYGGLQYGLVLTVAMILVALPVTLLHLIVGQLSQQDTVGIWKAIPFFKGIGYLRLLITYSGAIYTMIYVALTATYFFYFINNSMPLGECTESLAITEYYDNEDYVITSNMPLCVNYTFMGPVSEQPEYYLSMALIIAAIWILFPIVLYNPVKMTKRMFYVFSPLVLIFATVILSSNGDKKNLLLLHNDSDWRNFLEPYIWHIALTQALWSSQIAGGYLVSSAGTIYANTDIKWTALAFVGTNIISNWIGLLFWFAISGDDDMSTVAVLVQIRNNTDLKSLNTSWPLVVFALLFFSGILSMLTLLYPLYVRFQRVGGQKWRIFPVAASLIGAALSVTLLMGSLSALRLIEDIAVPFLISVTTGFEITAFVFIYGWKALVEDLKFLTGCDLEKYWVMGWSAAPGILAPVLTWWVISIIIHDSDSEEMPREAIALAVVSGLASLVFVTFASVAVAKQVQYDLSGKLKSSFKPSRHWGPRDPITHYYWLTRRDDAGGDHLSRNRYYRRQLGQFSGGVSVSNTSNDNSEKEKWYPQMRSRNYSDDWIYTVCRRKYLEELHYDYFDHSRLRSKSLDWTVSHSSKVKRGT